MNLPIRKELFWDVDYQFIDPDTHRLYIIERVLNLGSLEEFRFILQHYGKSSIREVLKEAGNLDPKSLAFALMYFGLRKSEMKCCTKKRLNQVHWN